MAGRGLDALLLYGSNLNGCGHPTYLANYIVKLPFAALVVLPRDGDAALIFQGATRGRSAARATTWIDDVRPCWNIAETCLAVLAERRLTTARIGLAAMPRLVPHDDWATLAGGLAGATVVSADDLIDHQRAIKSEREIAQVAHASQIVRHGLAAIGEAASSAGEWQLVARIMRDARMRGAEDLRVLIARTREPAWAFRPVEDLGFAEGETVSVLLAASWERYWAESIRTFRVASDQFELVHTAETDARFTELVAALRPGATIGECARAALASMSTTERDAIAPYGLGHGIGITPEEWPRLSADDQTTIASGMCFVVRGAFDSRDGIVLHGDTVSL
jgi:Xaa-Pro aminopeptidase